MALISLLSFMYHNGMSDVKITALAYLVEAIIRSLGQENLEKFEIVHIHLFHILPCERSMYSFNAGALASVI
jgi:hypothetical protein